LDIAVFTDRGLLDCFHFALQPRQLGGVLPIAADEESRRPENDNGHSRCNAVLCSLAVLRASGSSCAPRNALRFFGERLAELSPR
jgi:hypothetical protein